MNDLEEQDGKSEWPDPPQCAPPHGYASEHWSAHTLAFGGSGLGAAVPAAVVTVVYPR
jgi:hypothetical protein